MSDVNAPLVFRYVQTPLDAQAFLDTEIDTDPALREAVDEAVLAEMSRMAAEAGTDTQTFAQSYVRDLPFMEPLDRRTTATDVSEHADHDGESADWRATIAAGAPYVGDASDIPMPDWTRYEGVELPQAPLSDSQDETRAYIDALLEARATARAALEVQSWRSVHADTHARMGVDAWKAYVGHVERMHAGIAAHARAVAQRAESVLASRKAEQEAASVRVRALTHKATAGPRAILDVAAAVDASDAARDALLSHAQKHGLDIDAILTAAGVPPRDAAS